MQFSVFCALLLTSGFLVTSALSDNLGASYTGYRSHSRIRKHDILRIINNGKTENPQPSLPQHMQSPTSVSEFGPFENDYGTKIELPVIQTGTNLLPLKVEVVHTSPDELDPLLSQDGTNMESVIIPKHFPRETSLNPLEHYSQTPPEEYDPSKKQYGTKIGSPIIIKHIKTLTDVYPLEHDSPPINQKHAKKLKDTSPIIQSYWIQRPVYTIKKLKSNYIIPKKSYLEEEPHDSKIQEYPWPSFVKNVNPQDYPMNTHYTPNDELHQNNDPIIISTDPTEGNDINGHVSPTIDTNGKVLPRQHKRPYIYRRGPHVLLQTETYEPDVPLKLSSPAVGENNGSIKPDYSDREYNQGNSNLFQRHPREKKRNNRNRSNTKHHLTNLLKSRYPGYYDPQLNQSNSPQYLLQNVYPSDQEDYPRQSKQYPTNDPEHDLDQYNLQNPRHSDPDQSKSQYPDSNDKNQYPYRPNVELTYVIGQGPNTEKSDLQQQPYQTSPTYYPKQSNGQDPSSRGYYPDRNIPQRFHKVKHIIVEHYPDQSNLPQRPSPTESEQYPHQSQPIDYYPNKYDSQPNPRKKYLRIYRQYYLHQPNFEPIYDKQNPDRSTPTDQNDNKNSPYPQYSYEYIPDQPNLPQRPYSSEQEDYPHPSINQNSHPTDQEHFPDQSNPQYSYNMDQEHNPDQPNLPLPPYPTEQEEYPDRSINKHPNPSDQEDGPDQNAYQGDQEDYPDPSSLHNFYPNDQEKEDYPNQQLSHPGTPNYNRYKPHKKNSHPNKQERYRPHPGTQDYNEFNNPNPYPNYQQLPHSNEQEPDQSNIQNSDPTGHNSDHSDPENEYPSNQEHTPNQYNRPHRSYPDDQEHYPERPHRSYPDNREHYPEHPNRLYPDDREHYPEQYDDHPDQPNLKDPYSSDEEHYLDFLNLKPPYSSRRGHNPEQPNNEDPIDQKHHPGQSNSQHPYPTDLEHHLDPSNQQHPHPIGQEYYPYKFNIPEWPHPNAPEMILDHSNTNYPHQFNNKFAYPIGYPTNPLYPYPICRQQHPEQSYLPERANTYSRKLRHNMCTVASDMNSSMANVVLWIQKLSCIINSLTKGFSCFNFV